MRRLTARAATVTSLVLLGGVLAACGEDDVDTGSEPTVTAEPSEESTPSESSESPGGSDEARADGPPRVVDTVVEGLAAPWGLDFLPDGTAILTERDTRLVKTITPGGRVTELGEVSEAVPASEAGLLGVAVSPDFAEDRALFFYFTTDADNRVARTTLEGGQLGDLEVVLDGIPLNTFHDGGRLAFGPDGMLYVSTGDAGDPDLAQDPESLAGKILRITPEGRVPADNPTEGSPVYSLGHRNVQGLAFDSQDRLWASEFGDQTFDELNLIEPGANYGWPINEGQGDVRGGELTNPQVVWGTDEASPSGLAYADGSLWVAALQGERVWRVPLDGARAREPQDLFVGEHGRIREIQQAPDGDLWVVTNNTDSRGEPREGDDRILVVRP